ncbi:hypothetical protein CEXT_633631 [Caerostris extrusa]|uniref:Uncharacterized protein n=1 Tax=Caerostris extrusa TaxID=172846 RepID=A0AAV4RER6_CAEEX|nr:hypothetical protein CEXT_633631 [Caerostris extrusa]
MQEIAVLKYSFPFCNCPITLPPLCVIEIIALSCKDLLDPMDLFIYLDGPHLRTRHRPPINRSHQGRAMGIRSNCRRGIANARDYRFEISFPFLNCPITLLPLCVIEINALCCKDLLDAMDLFIYLDGGHLRTRHRPPINRSHQIRAKGIQSNCRRAFFFVVAFFKFFSAFSHLLQD